MDEPSRAKRPIGLGLVLACLVGTLILGGAQKAYCASGDWTDGRQYRLLCYSDIVPLLGTEQLQGDRIPFLDACSTQAAAICDEYPVLTMFFMRSAAWISGPSNLDFFWTNAALLSMCAIAAAICLYLLAGSRSLILALAPTLLIYGFMNWDMFAVALGTGALLAFANRRDTLAGVLLGLGAAAKMYPILLVVPLIAERLRTREPDRAIRLGWSTAGTWVVVNLPFALAAPHAWSTFFRFNSSRGADFDSFWYLACSHVNVAAICGHVKMINLASGALFLSLFALVWVLRRDRYPDFPRWELVFPMIVLFLLTNKVYSPQFGLWLLPLFALTLPNLRAFIAFELADIGVFVTRFWFFSHYPNGDWEPAFLRFEIAVWVRFAVLIGCLVLWIRRRPEPLEGEIAFDLPQPTVRAAHE